MGTVFFEGASELATLTNTFTVAGVPTDPTTITLLVTDPTGTSNTYTFAGGQITRTSAGVYTKDIPCTLAGTWTYKWTGTSAASDISAGTWEVQETALGRLYCTVEMLKSRFKDTRTVDDLEYHSACFTASRAIEQYCGRVFYRTASQARSFNPTDEYCLELPAFSDLVSVSTFKTDNSGDGVYETTWAASDYQLLTADGSPNVDIGPEQRPYTNVRALARTFPMVYSPTARNDRIEITGVWGWPAVPWSIKQAAAIVAAETFKLKDAPGMAVQGYEDFEISALSGELRRQFARFASPYRKRIPGFA